MPLRLCTGLVDAKIVRLPCCAICMAVTPAITVLPTPPLPPKNMNLSLGCATTKSVKDCLISPMSRPPIAVHHPGQLLNHRQSGHIPLQLGHTSDHLLAEGFVNLV